MRPDFDKQMPLAIGSDHAGFALKEVVKKKLEALGWTVSDQGTHSAESTDYPDYAHAVADSVAGGKAAGGILICGSGIGVCITANRHAGVRAALCWTPELAALTRQHNNANVLCLPARFVTEADALEMVETFLATAFEGGRHGKRVDKIELTP